MRYDWPDARFLKLHDPRCSPLRGAALQEAPVRSSPLAASRTGSKVPAWRELGTILEIKGDEVLFRGFQGLNHPVTLESATRHRTAGSKLCLSFSSGRPYPRILAPASPPFVEKCRDLFTSCGVPLGLFHNGRSVGFCCTYTFASANCSCLLRGEWEPTSPLIPIHLPELLHLYTCISVYLYICKCVTG